jgi:hypothetical protein
LLLLHHRRRRNRKDLLVLVRFLRCWFHLDVRRMNWSEKSESLRRIVMLEPTAVGQPWASRGRTVGQPPVGKKSWSQPWGNHRRQPAHINIRRVEDRRAKALKKLLAKAAYMKVMMEKDKNIGQGGQGPRGDGGGGRGITINYNNN